MTMSLLHEIKAKCSPELLASKQHGEIAAKVSEGRTRIATRLGGIGVVMETLGPVDGPALLDALEMLKASNPAVKWAWYLIERGELDFGSPGARGMIDMIEGGGLIGKEAAQALRNIAVFPAPVSVQEVVQAMEGV